MLFIPLLFLFILLALMGIGVRQRLSERKTPVDPELAKQLAVISNVALQKSDPPWKGAHAHFLKQGIITLIVSGAFLSFTALLGFPDLFTPDGLFTYAVMAAVFLGGIWQVMDAKNIKDPPGE